MKTESKVKFGSKNKSFINVNKKLLIMSLKKSFFSIWNAFPMILAIVLLISLLNSYLGSFSISSIFSGIEIIDAFFANVVGSILAGSPITSYIIGGELLKSGVSLFVVTCFIVSWVTVGVVQFPAESVLLSKRFAITRNVFSFIFSFVVSLIVVVVVSLL